VNFISANLAAIPVPVMILPLKNIARFIISHLFLGIHNIDEPMDLGDYQEIARENDGEIEIRNQDTGI